MKYRIGIDTGGTFTDITLFCEDTGRIWSSKVPSTPAEPSDAILDGIRHMAEIADIGADEIVFFGHGTTVATNSLIERKGARTGLITTRGFKDLLEIGRQRRPSLYEFDADKPPVLIPRHLRLEVTERALPSGEVLRGISDEEIEHAIRVLLKEKVESIAVCFLYSFLNPEHEKRVRRVLEGVDPNAYIYLSSDVMPEFREFERLSTTVLCAYLGPVVGNYTELLRRRVKAAGMKTAPYITQSNGGIMSCQSVKEKPIETAMSGLASGVIAAAFLGSRTGIDNLITLDMGGTSADVALIQENDPRVSTDKTVIGYPVKTPMIDVDTIGAGGGSIAWVDDGHALKVGPQSAGADPGPVCYGKGGQLPTVTDANLILGRINQEFILGGRMKVYPQRARAALEEKICTPLAMDVVEAASGIIKIVNSHMIRAIRNISVERGHDPREFTLLGFGGAGPLHAVAVARELNVGKVLIPQSPGTLSSLGLLVADYRSDFVRTKIMPAGSNTLAAVNAIFDDLTERAKQWLAGENVPAAAMVFEKIIDMRYLRQNFELQVPVGEGRLNEENLAGLLQRFHREHERAHGYNIPENPVELVNFRVIARGIVTKAELKSYEASDDGPENALAGERRVYFEESAGFVDTPIYLMAKLTPAQRLKGPAVIEQKGSTILLPPRVEALIDAYKNLHVTLL